MEDKISKLLLYRVSVRSTPLSGNYFSIKEQQQQSRSLSNFFLSDRFRRGDRNPREKQTRERGGRTARGFYYLKCARESERTACSFLEKRVARIPALKRPCGTRGSARISANAAVHHDSAEQNFKFPPSRTGFSLQFSISVSHSFQFISFFPSLRDIIKMCSSEQGGRVGSRKSICRKGEPVYLNESYPRVPWKPTAILKSNSPCNNPAPPPTVNFYDCQNDRRRTHFSNVWFRRLFFRNLSLESLESVLHWREKLARFIGARYTEGRIIDRNTVFIRSRVRSVDRVGRMPTMLASWNASYFLLPFMDGVGMLSPRSFNIESILHGGHNAIRMWVTRTASNISRGIFICNGQNGDFSSSFSQFKPSFKSLVK